MVLYYVHVTVWLYAGILMICGWVEITKIFMYLPKMVFKRLSYFMVIILKFSTTWSNVRKLYEKVTQEEIDNWNSPMEILKLGYNCFTVLSWFLPFQFSSVASHVRLFATPWTAAHQASLSITNFWSSLKLMFIQSVTWKRMKIILLFLRLHPGTEFCTLLLTVRTTSFLLRDSCPQ